MKASPTQFPVEHDGMTLLVQYPFLRPEPYSSLKGSIARKNQRMATRAETISIMVHALVEHPSSDYSRRITAVLNDKWLYAATKSLWVPESGVYIFDDDQSIPLPPALKERIGPLTSGELETLLDVIDEYSGLVTFLRFGTFQTGELASSESLAHNPYATRGQSETARKLALIADSYMIHHPQVNAHTSVREPSVTVTTLDSDYSGHNRLVLAGNDDGDEPAFAFAVKDLS